MRPWLGLLSACATVIFHIFNSIKMMQPEGLKGACHYYLCDQVIVQSTAY